MAFLTTSYTRLWILREGYKPLYTTCGVSKVEIIPDDTGRWVCGFCGSTIEDSISCDRCNAPRKSRKRKGTIHIYGYLPESRILDDLKDKFFLQILSGCGRANVYTPQNIFLAAERCNVVEKWIDNLVAICSDDVCVVRLDLIIEADISLRFQDDN